MGRGVCWPRNEIFSSLTHASAGIPYLQHYLWVPLKFGMGMSSRHFGRDSPCVAGQLLLESRAVRLALKSQAKGRELQARRRACVGAGAAPVLTTAGPQGKAGVEIKPLARALLLSWNTWNCSKTPWPTEADLSAQVLRAFLPGERNFSRKIGQDTSLGMRNNKQGAAHPTTETTRSLLQS